MVTAAPPPPAAAAPTPPPATPAASQDEATSAACNGDGTATSEQADSSGGGDLASKMGETTLSDEPASTLPAHAPPTVQQRMVQQTPQEALRTLALSIYERARAADNPKSFPSPSTHWGVVEAPTIARGLHAAAVILDCMKRFDASASVPPDLLPFQTAAHRRSQQLSSQIHSAFKTAGPVDSTWAPVDVGKPFASFKPPPKIEPPPPPPPNLATMFPSAPSTKPR